MVIVIAYIKIIKVIHVYSQSRKTQKSIPSIDKELLLTLGCVSFEFLFLFM